MYIYILPPERSKVSVLRFPNFGCFGPLCFCACTPGYRAYGRLYLRSELNLIHIFQWLSAQPAWVWACCVACTPQAALSLGALARKDWTHFVKSGVFEPRPSLGYCSDDISGSNVGKHLNQIRCSSDPMEATFGGLPHMWALTTPFALEARMPPSAHSQKAG